MRTDPQFVEDHNQRRQGRGATIHPLAMWVVAATMLVGGLVAVGARSTPDASETVQVAPTQPAARQVLAATAASQTQTRAADSTAHAPEAPTPPAAAAAAPAPAAPIVAEAATASTAFSFPTIAAPTPTVAGCDGGYSSADLNALIHNARTGAGGIVGADYARVQRLPDGRVLWVFQDVFVGGDGTSLHHARFMHNAGLIQDGSCFQVLTGDHGSWIGSDVESPLHHWFWPLDSVVTADGHLAQFMVEMNNPTGRGATGGAVPVRVWIATIDMTDFSVVGLNLAPDSSDRPLYGFSITSDAHFHYLYGNCYRQFADAGWPFAHDTTCGPRTYVARVPLGHPEMTPEYWNGVTWSSMRQHAAPVLTRGQLANPMQVRRVGDIFVSVTKIDDWWDNTVAIDIARSPQGPWTSVTTMTVPTMCGEKCNTYFAELLPWTDADGSLLIVISNNAWDMEHDAFAEPLLYRPGVLTVPVPAVIDVPFAQAGASCSATAPC